MQIRTYLLPIFLFSFHCYASNIMINHAGDAKQTGRLIGDSFERAITYEIACSLKAALQQKNHSIILTHEPGQTMLPKQNIQYANRVGVDLYIHIQCAEDSSQRPSCLLFYHNPIAMNISATAPVLIPIEKAHIAALEKTKKIVSTIATHLSAPEAYGLACAPLSGLLMPAFCIEFIVEKKHDWSSFIAPMTQAIDKALTQ